MKICVIGTGYVGLVTGACLAQMGHQVVCTDVDEEKISKLCHGLMPIYEPGLDEIVTENRKRMNLEFSTNIEAGVKASELIFICVGTPSDENGAADLSSVKKVAKKIGRAINSYKIIVNKSTVPVGSIRLVSNLIRENASDFYNFDVVSNPEFLREGTAVSDFFKPDRIIIGSTNEKASAVMEELYRPLKAPVLITDPESSEMTKYASNAFLATKISFINEIARICEKIGADVKEVAKGMGYDKRIGPEFLEAGAGWGGSCLPKDSKALVKMAEEHNCNFSLLEGAVRINEEQQNYVTSKVEKMVGELRGKRIGVMGLSFKPNTDDVRDSPAIAIIEKIKAKGAKVKVYDPVAEENFKKILTDVEYCDDAYQVTEGSNALLFLTAWEEFKNLDFPKIKELIEFPAIVDARNCLDPGALREMGFLYEGIGR